MTLENQVENFFQKEQLWRQEVENTRTSHIYLLIVQMKTTKDTKQEFSKNVSDLKCAQGSLRIQSMPFFNFDTQIVSNT